MTARNCAVDALRRSGRETAVDVVPEDADDTLERLDEALTVHAGSTGSRRLPRDPRPVLLPRRELPHDRRGARAPAGTIAKVARRLSRLRDVLDPAPDEETASEEKSAGRGPSGGKGGKDTMTPEERIAEVLRALPAPPRGWVEAAKELPAARRELATILERVERDERYRELVVADLESMLLFAEGIEPTPVVVAHLRRSLAS